MTIISVKKQINKLRQYALKKKIKTKMRQQGRNLNK